MARQRSPNREKAKQLYLQSNGVMKLIDIAAELDIKDSQVRKWKSQDEWDTELKGALPNKKGSVTNRKGGQPGNKNAVGNSGGSAPEENKNAEKHGFFSKWLPAETAEIMRAIEKTDPLDILWDNIQLQYTAIIRAQKLMYVKDQHDKTTTKIEEKDGNVWGERWEVQQAWDKHATFLNAQSRAMKTLEGMIKNYDELLHKNWDLATEEQKARINKLKAETAKIKGDDPKDEKEDDGFMEALSGKVDKVWQE